MIYFFSSYEDYDGHSSKYEKQKKKERRENFKNIFCVLWISVFSHIHLSPLETVHHGNKWTNCEGMNFFSEIQTHLSQQLQPIRLETTYFFLKKNPK